MDASGDTLKRKARLREILNVLIEAVKWEAVIWLLLPLLGLTKGAISVGRVVTGICLFVVFTGKLFYDTMIAEFVRQQRTTWKQDLVAILGMIAAVVFLIGFVVFMVALLLTQWQEAASQGSGG
jgi:polyferredoxin